MPATFEQNQSNIEAEPGPISVGYTDFLAQDDLEWLTRERSMLENKREGGVLTADDEFEIGMYGIELARERVEKDKHERSDEDFQAAILNLDLAEDEIAERLRQEIDKNSELNLEIGRTATQVFKTPDCPTVQTQTSERKRKSHNKDTRGQYRNRGFSIKSLLKERPTPEDIEKKKGGWPNFNARGISFTPRVELRAPSDPQDKRVDIRLSRSEKHGAEKDIRITYYPDKAGDGVIFSGMIIPKELRGLGMGVPLFKYFLEGLKKKGLEFTGTSQINKPMLALVLRKAGLVPKNTDYLAVVLKYDNDNTDAESTITYIKDAGDGPRKVTGTKGGKVFYRQVDPATVPTSILKDKNKWVAVHTEYVPRSKIRQ